MHVGWARDALPELPHRKLLLVLQSLIVSRERQRTLSSGRNGTRTNSNALVQCRTNSVPFNAVYAMKFVGVVDWRPRLKMVNVLVCGEELLWTTKRCGGASRPSPPCPAHHPRPLDGCRVTPTRAGRRLLRVAFRIDFTSLTTLRDAPDPPLDVASFFYPSARSVAPRLEAVSSHTLVISRGRGDGSALCTHERQSR